MDALWSMPHREAHGQIFPVGRQGLGKENFGRVTNQPTNPDHPCMGKCT